ncbi:MAG: hypothetical protein AAF367_09505 [Pseudomonadota bacterium]
MRKRVVAFGGALLALLALPALGDDLPVFDEKGQAQTIDTTSLTGCQVIFDSAGTPFELCRMQKVELRPPQSTRARPGHGAPASDVSVIYTKKIPQ